MTENKQVMAKNIQRYMERDNVKATDICKTLGFKQNTFSDWVNAKTYPRIDAIEKLANYFHVSKADLVEDADITEKSMFKANIQLLSKFRARKDKYETLHAFKLQELESIEKELAVYGFSVRAIRYNEMLENIVIQQLLDAAYGCEDEQIQIAINMLNTFKRKE